MREITAETAADYLRDSGRVPREARVDVRELTGGVSNIVLRVDVPGNPPLVIKQCRERLRVAMDWRARLDRIWTEYATLELLRVILPDGTVPQVLFEDQPNYLFAMSCAPDDAVTWKTHLMAGLIDADVASRLGVILARIHTDAPGRPALRERLSDTSLFEELRVDPYYRTAARAHPDLAPRIDALIDSMDLPTHERTLVLGDFSPKNILVHSGGLILLDFECAHAGDPAFDLGFFLTHLLLKTVRAQYLNPESSPRYAALAGLFWTAYLEARRLDSLAAAALARRSILHTAACVLSRVDGKSPVEYLDTAGQAVARSFARAALQSAPETWEDFMALFENVVYRDTPCQG
jgi:5-methylthioribose kinase